MLMHTASNLPSDASTPHDHLHTGGQKREVYDQRTWLAPLSIAPMMQRTDRHYRYMMRRMTRHTLLWSEMITARAMQHGLRPLLLSFDVDEHPVVLQVGGDDPLLLADAARIASDYGYDEININVGCPSERVQSGNFGACLMSTPDLVARCVKAMRQASNIPVTVKHRIGIDEIDRYEDMLHFVRTVADAGGCARFTVHARKAWLKGLSPKENRTIPPLRYEDVYRLKRECPELMIEINGGVETVDEVLAHLEHVDAVMIGRAAYNNPFLFAHADAHVFGASTPCATRREVVLGMMPYVDRFVAQGTPLHRITRHMINLYAGCRGAKRWRQHISTRHHIKGAGSEVLQEALDFVDI